MEHRWGKRRPADIGVYLRTESGLAANGRLSDVSLSGALVVTPLPLPLHCRLNISFSPGAHPRWRTVSLEAEVIRRTPDGFGIEWREFGHEAIRAMTLELDPAARAHHEDRAHGTRTAR